MSLTCAIADALLRAAGIRMHGESAAEAGRNRLGRAFYLLTTVFFGADVAAGSASPLGGPESAVPIVSRA